jgi:MarR family transcriptional repressor of emrRAB
MRCAALTVLLNQVAPEELAALERVAETMAVALPEDTLSALTTCRFCDERRCIDCPMEVFGLLDPRQFDRHGGRLVFGQNTYNSKRDCK